MLNYKYKIILIIVFFSLIRFATGQSGSSSSMEQIGTSAANFLKIGIGARALAMAGAAVADCDNISALYWNAGGLARMPKNQVLFQQTNWLVDTKIYYLGIGYHLPSIGTIGLSLHNFSSGDIEETTLLEPNGTGRNFSADDFALGVTYSRMITDRFSTGITIKFIEESLDREKARTIAFDIGSLFQTGFFNDMRIGMSLSNLGGTMQFSGTDLSVQHTSNPDYPTKVIQANLDTDEWDLPLYFRFGLATDVYKKDNYRFSVSSEVMDSRDFIHRIAFGGEIAYSESLFLRGGYKLNEDEQDFSLGVGYNLDLGWAGMRLDYAYSNFGIFDISQQFSIIFLF